jgi:hypothetical protein
MPARSRGSISDGRRSMPATDDLPDLDAPEFAPIKTKLARLLSGAQGRHRRAGGQRRINRVAP